MKNSTYTQIANVTLAASSSSILISNLPLNYRDLVFVINAGGAGASTFFGTRFNGDSGANYVRQQMFSGSTPPTSLTNGNETSFFANNRGATSSATIINLMDYSATDKHKLLLVKVADGVQALISSGRWASTSAITSISLTPDSGNFSAGSSFTIYGIGA